VTEKLQALFTAWWVTMTPDQWCLLALSLLAAWLVCDHRPKVQRWGPVFGLASQPFWLWTGWANPAAGGVFVMSALYCVVWARGIYNGWWR
jgi:hypothetical protein